MNLFYITTYQQCHLLELLVVQAIDPQPQERYKHTSTDVKFLQIYKQLPDFNTDTKYNKNSDLLRLGPLFNKPGPILIQAQIYCDINSF